MVQKVHKSGSKEKPELKAGHARAVKAGGKRVSKKSLEESGVQDMKRPEKVRPPVASNRMQQIGILLTGALDKLSHDFPETPVSVRHSRLRPAVEKPHVQRSYFIQQPRKY
ncbi:death associated protein 1b [Synchiropus splendidus]|uniref:death associated protein 1b n=1 Tax=Synchiropus splendidus TaxID=270530 RepID=UPI00237EE177|nr:death associated protein 1b [Synchiropus splendidus]